MIYPFDRFYLARLYLASSKQHSFRLISSQTDFPIIIKRNSICFYIQSFTFIDVFVNEKQERKHIYPNT
jgi:hypothetical protein